MAEDLELFSEEEQNSAAYKACVAGTTIVGLAIGRLGGVGGLIVGGVAGAVYGLMSCKKIAPAIRRKLLSRAETLTSGEVGALTAELQRRHPRLKRSDALELLANIQLETIKTPVNIARWSD